MRPYRPRQMSKRWLSNAPEIVLANVLDIFENPRGTVCEYDILFRPVAEKGDDVNEIVGLDFGKDGGAGCHFFLKPHEASAYRYHNKHRRRAWEQLPAKTKEYILDYLES